MSRAVETTRVYYDVWDRVTANLIAEFTSLVEARAWVRRYLSQEGDDIVILRVETGKSGATANVRAMSPASEQ